MKATCYSIIFILAFLGQCVWAASTEVALGPVVKKQQSQDGSYWIQLVAVKKAEAVDRVKKENTDYSQASKPQFLIH